MSAPASRADAGDPAPLGRSVVSLLWISIVVLLAADIVLSFLSPAAPSALSLAQQRINEIALFTGLAVVKLVVLWLARRPRVAALLVLALITAFEAAQLILHARAIGAELINHGLTMALAAAGQLGAVAAAIVAFALIVHSYPRWPTPEHATTSD